VELDGSAAGFVESVEGGDVFSDVVVEKVGVDGIAHKHLAGVRYDDLALVVGPNMSKSFFEWIASTLDRKFTRKDGAVSFQDYSGRAGSSRRSASPRWTPARGRART
jgi:hypothetical protein